MIETPVTAWVITRYEGGLRIVRIKAWLLGGDLDTTFLTPDPRRLRTAPEGL